MQTAVTTGANCYDMSIIITDTRITNAVLKVTCLVSKFYI